MTEKTVRAAANAIADAKILALARLLADGLQRPSSCDKHRLWASAMADLEEPHLWLLETLERRSSPVLDISDKEWNDPRAWRLQQLAQPLPDLIDELGLLLATLSRTGLVVVAGSRTSGQAGNMRKARYTIAAPGRRVLHDLLDAAEGLERA